jgi:plasmid stability protein
VIALSRYSSAMATIQIRDIPEESYEVLRRRARREGRSLQTYLRQEIIDLAVRPTKAEALARIEAVLKRVHGEEPTADSVLADIGAGRR